MLSDEESLIDSYQTGYSETDLHQQESEIAIGDGKPYKKDIGNQKADKSKVCICPVRCY